MKRTEILFGEFDKHGTLQDMQTVGRVLQKKMDCKSLSTYFVLTTNQEVFLALYQPWRKMPTTKSVGLIS